jgi:excisionase family DNA binding protein
MVASAPPDVRATVPTLEKLIFKLDELNFVFGISRSSAYRAMAAGKLRSIKAGGRRMFKREDIDAFLVGGVA